MKPSRSAVDSLLGCDRITVFLRHAPLMVFDLTGDLRPSGSYDYALWVRTPTGTEYDNVLYFSHSQVEAMTIHDNPHKVTTTLSLPKAPE